MLSDLEVIGFGISRRWGGEERVMRVMGRSTGPFAVGYIYSLRPLSMMVDENKSMIHDVSGVDCTRVR